MKVVKNNILLVALSILLATVISCDDNIHAPTSTENLLPTTFSVKVPTSITSGSTGGRTSGRITEEDFNGNKIYELLGLFISLGEEAGNITEAIMGSFGEFGINRAMVFSFNGDDDGRAKNLEVIENVEYEGVNYAFRMTITDADSEGNTDGGVAMQIFWNVEPIVGVSLLKPFNMNRNNDDGLDQAIFRIDYSENGSLGYDAHMTVSIVDLPLGDASTDPFAIDNLKLFVGKKGDNVDVFGNSNHPNAALFTQDLGFDWAFTASGLKDDKMAVVEVGLPPITLDATDRSAILVDYSIHKVFSDQILAEFPNATQEIIDPYLVNTEAPGYFGSEGFIQGGTSPGEAYDPLAARILDLTPYNPSDINNLTVSFQ